ncbi:MAG: hypothetical protein HOA08_09985 [Rhodospirillaceae bacterium]|jgi:hypothetical protein|nr:hypothetical protein [Rhodospirillaceae bacterium]MBT4746352.1 hypothetical protein [Rhodospirillaceae bacterium]MBT6975241.1 hypothetical protein [Rhodospirillaceae bacterium]MBT7837377.1 hypothetical protein [Rhodospirillaceae bacterium]
MGIIRNLTLVMTLLFLPSTVAAARNAHQQDANALYKYCGGGANTWNESYCFRYVTSVLERAKEEGRPLPACQPKGASKGQVVDAIRAWLADHPEEQPGSAENLIAKALMRIWPCK